MALFATQKAAEAAGYVQAHGYSYDIMGASLRAGPWNLNLVPVYAEDREHWLTDIWPNRLGRVEQVLLTDEVNAANQRGTGCYVRMLSPQTLQTAIHHATRAMTAIRKIVPAETLGTIARLHREADAAQAQREERLLLDRAMDLGIGDMPVIDRPVNPDGSPATMMDYGRLCGSLGRRPAHPQHLRNTELLRAFLRAAST